MVRYWQKCEKQIAGICGFCSQASIMSCSCDDNEINPQGMFSCGVTLWWFPTVDCLWHACESLGRVVCGEHWCNMFGDNQEGKHFEMFPSSPLRRQYPTLRMRIWTIIVLTHKPIWLTQTHTPLNRVSVTHVAQISRVVLTEGWC